MEAAGADPAVVAAMQNAQADYKNIHGTATVSNRGVTRSVALDVSKVNDPTMKQMMTSMSSTFNNLSMPLPEEAVGVGAKWEVRQGTSAGGLQSFTKSVFELTAFDGKTATLKLTLEQSAGKQPG